MAKKSVMVKNLGLTFSAHLFRGSPVSSEPRTPSFEKILLHSLPLGDGGDKRGKIFPKERVRGPLETPEKVRPRFFTITKKSIVISICYVLHI